VNESISSRQNHARVSATTAWNEHRVKAALRKRGIATPRGVLIPPGEPLSDIDVPYPLVVKVCSASILHKTEVGGVVLGVRDAAELSRVVEGLRSRFPDESLLVESMEPPGIEVIIGVVRDVSFGPVIMFGMGGVLAELQRDVVFRMLPIGLPDAEEMIDGIRGAGVLAGFRGIKADRESLIRLLLSVSDLAGHWGDALVQMDLNPVFVRPDDVIVVDAKVLMRQGAKVDG
jgi:hypothetical protein